MMNYLLVVTLLAVARLSVAQQQPDSFQISVSVNLVLLNPVVQDAKGQFVASLQQHEFEVREEGVPQTITVFRHEDVPVTVGLVIDHSGSMHRKLPDVLTAARTFVKWSNPADQMFIVNFNEKAALGLPPDRHFSNSPEELEKAILSAPLAGQTAVYDAVALALTRLPVGGPQKKVLIVISDGGDNTSTLKLAELLKLTGQSSALIYAIGIFDENETDRNPTALRRLASASGGAAYFPEKTTDVIELCESIAHEIRNQYTVGYISSNPPKPGVFRPVKVTAHAPGKGHLVVRARTGYIAAGDEVK